MTTKRTTVILLSAAIVLLVAATSAARGNAQTTPSPQGIGPEGAKIDYPGRLSDDGGRPVVDGRYSFAFELCANEFGGVPLWSELREDVKVNDGAFTVKLGEVSEIPAAILLAGDTLWLQVAVRGPNDTDFVSLSPRKSVGSPESSAAAASASGASCPHDHWGETWTGTDDQDAGLTVENRDGAAVVGWSQAADRGAVSGYNSSGYAVYGWSVWGNGVGAYGETSNGAGFTRRDRLGLWWNGGTPWPAWKQTHCMLLPTARARFLGINDSGNSSPALEATTNGSGLAGYFRGDVRVTGTLHKQGGGFQIDHPLEPEDKYLYHSFVESPDMKNVYDGVVELEADGTAWVELPAWFEALNGDCRYQLTCIGAFAPVYVAQEIIDSRFQIAGGAP